MKRHESRNISRSRKMIQALNPCSAYSHNGGHNPFDYLFAKFIKQGSEDTPEEKAMKHELKIAQDKKQATLRKARKRNKV